ncbi:putative isoprenylcysteine alpha-carbonyl methylesterase ICMEL1 [Smittium mucronatum]|uniref:Putative isoprenylcysteine alpha-carbonyl methylesterase ICMEL1 n=1 Tax=Smittium mucronatum TaxID=133383 RepID=A0A1R0GXD5_9FUNG|nr:putative isoprenylcysteine alpha-carbonyl methylesterase ICMEL1 [Smittium mucronatum]
MTPDPNISPNLQTPPQQSYLYNYSLRALWFLVALILFPITVPMIYIRVNNFGIRALPLDPFVVYNRAKALFLGVLDGIGGPTIPLLYAFFKQRLMYSSPLSDTSISGISYGKLPRQKMDIFVPISLQKTKEQNSGTPKPQPGNLPVIIVFPGYSWNSTTGLIQLYKPMAQTLCDTGVFVILPNLGLPGKTSLIEIMEDMQLVVEWTARHIEKSGGDPQQIHLLGFGAGAHMCAMYNIASSLSGLQKMGEPMSRSINKILSTQNADAELLEWLSRLTHPVLPVSGLILISGVYSLELQRKYESSRCIDTLSMSSRFFDSIDYAEAWSPLNIHRGLRKRGVFIPSNFFAKRVLIVHGQKDSTFPLDVSQQMFQEYCLLDMDDVNMKVYANLRRIDPSVILSVQDASLAKSFLEDIKAAISPFDSDSDTLNASNNSDSHDEELVDHVDFPQNGLLKHKLDSYGSLSESDFSGRSSTPEYSDSNTDS